MPSPVIVVNDRATAADVRVMREALRAAIRECDADEANARAAHAALAPCFDLVRDSFSGIDGVVNGMLSEMTHAVGGGRRAIEDVKVANGIVLGMYLQRELDKAVIRG